MTAELSAPAVPTLRLTIDGALVDAAQRLAVINPATAQPFVEVPSAAPADLDRAVAAANRAAVGWRRLDPGERRRLVQAFADTVRAHLDELALLLTLEQGKPLGRAKGEIESGLRYVEAAAATELPVETIRDDAGERIVVRRVPVGVVAAITAWNYPLLLALWKIGPALAAGNTVIVKPSPYTPAATLRVGELAQEVLPAGVLQVLAGGDDVGRALVEHEGIHKISFTGSQHTGKAIMAGAASTLKRLTLELGGNDAGVVLPDADPATIASDLYWGGLSNCGQVCAGLKRLYVPRQQADAYAEALAEIARQVVVGDGLDDDVVMGPVQNAPQLERVRGLVDDAGRRGAEVFFRGQAPDGPGYFYPVTLIRGAGDDVPVVAEEQFGPVLPILTYDSVDEAVDRANATPFGLGASVWSSNPDRATDVADRLEAGTVWVNQHPMLSPDTPFGGLKQSGIGVEASLHGLLAYTDISVLRVKR